MRNSVWILATIVACVVIVGLSGLLMAGGASGGAKAPPIDTLLVEFSKAVSQTDIKKMEALFLPPDDSPAGKNRQEHLAEMKKDWAALKGRGAKVSVSFKDTRTIVRTTLICREGKEPAELVPAELEVVLTEAGWRIVAMRYLPKPQGP